MSDIIERTRENKYLLILSSILSLLTLATFTLLITFYKEIPLVLTHSLLGLILALAIVKNLRSGNNENFNLIFSITYITALLATLYFNGTEYTHWLYAAIASSYFLLSLKNAIFINIMTVIASVPIILSQVSLGNTVNLYTTIALVLFIGYMFTLRNEQQKQQLITLASEDKLTGLKNQKLFYEKLSETIEEHLRAKQKTSLLILDLDNFKRINDRYSYEQGNDVLKSTAKVLKNKLRITDRVYRFEGDKFAVVAFNTTLKGAGHLAELLRDDIQQTKLLANERLTVSIGVAQISMVDDTDSWLKNANTALSGAKISGGNTTFLATPEDRCRSYEFEPIMSNDKIEQEEDNDSQIISLKSYRNKKLIDSETTL